MPSVNDVLMGRTRAAPVSAKRKRSASSSVSPSAAPGHRSGASPALKARRGSQVASAPSSSAAQQTYIDVGQRGFGRRSTCRKCGLLYTVGEAEDEKEHAAFCKRAGKGVTIPKWKSERLLKAFPNEDARIIELRAEDPAAHVRKLRELKALLDDALGVVDERAFLRRSLLVYVSGTQAVGCVTLESVTRAVPLDPAADGRVDLPDASSDDSSKPALVGVSQIWVSPAFRRRKVASRLLDASREAFIYGMRVPVEALAFAQPTQDGLALAAAYVAPHAVLVYDS